MKSLSPLNQKSIFKYNFEIKEGATEKVRKTLFHPKSEENLACQKLAENLFSVAEQYS